jgi:cation diffusion facilitator CzcD-associated flavoprotein CzcO
MHPKAAFEPVSPAVIETLTHFFHQRVQDTPTPTLTTSMAGISTDTGLSEMTVRRGIHQLEREGKVIMLPAETPHRPNTYVWLGGNQSTVTLPQNVILQWQQQLQTQHQRIQMLEAQYATLKQKKAQLEAYYKQNKTLA